MKYGIIQKGDAICCANCDRTVTSADHLDKHYCEECGAPLSVEAIAEYQENMQNERTRILTILKDIAVEKHTDSFLEILKQYKQDEE